MPQMLNDQQKPDFTYVFCSLPLRLFAICLIVWICLTSCLSRETPLILGAYRRRATSILKFFCRITSWKGRRYVSHNFQKCWKLEHLISYWVSQTCSVLHFTLFLSLMTLRAPHWALRHLDRISQEATLAIICCKLSGSDRMIVSNSANFPTIEMHGQ